MQGLCTNFEKNKDVSESKGSVPPRIKLPISASYHKTIKPPNPPTPPIFTLPNTPPTPSSLFGQSYSPDMRTFRTMKNQGLAKFCDKMERFNVSSDINNVAMVEIGFIATV